MPGSERKRQPVSLKKKSTPLGGRGVEGLDQNNDDDDDDDDDDDVMILFL